MACRKLTIESVVKFVHFTKFAWNLDCLSAKQIYRITLVEQCFPAVNIGSDVDISTPIVLFPSDLIALITFRRLSY